jgi:hypothetical protein
MSQIASVVAPEGSSEWLLRGGVCTLCGYKVQRIEFGFGAQHPRDLQNGKGGQNSALTSHGRMSLDLSA